MAVSRVVAAMLIGASVTAGCTSGHGDKKTSTSPSGTTSSSGAVCTQASAETARQTLITKAGFSPACVKIKAKAQFFFVNNDAKTLHTVTTEAGTPAKFDVKLPKKNSTYTQIFKAKGTYIISDKTTKKTMTLIVS
jgi:plastocyanin